MVGLLKEKRGAIEIQFALMLPILIIILIGGFEVWKILYVRQTLNDAVYQGVRMLALRPNRSNIQNEVKALVRRSAATNPFIGTDAYDRLDIQLTAYDAHCFSGQEGTPGKLTIQVGFPWVLAKELGGREGRTTFRGFLSFLNAGFILQARATGTVLCEWRANGP